MDNIKTTLEDGISHYKDGRYKEALPIFNKLKQIDGLAVYYLAMMYLKGRGVEKSEFFHIASLLQQSYDLKCGKAAREIGKIYTSGNMVQVNKDTAIKWFNIAISLGDLASYYYLGEIYYFRKDDDDKTRAFNSCKSGAERGNYKCITEYGYCLYNGQGCLLNKDRGLELLLKGAKRRK